ncbi:hypothetical protein AI2971V1_0719 [Klebsiella pneumoniae]|nr:hypothetical protein AI2971V1_0719 [Klebsiella pneumoniae]CAH5155789.1 hypothetical protein AI2971V1_0719 [Klebsiella pneumoniae]
MMRQSYLPLFRACCQCTYPDPALRTDEIIVFFEAEDRVRASKKIVRLLADLWGCRESFVEVWNLEDEHELVLLWSSFFGHADQMVGLCTGGQLGGRAGQRFVLCG